MTSIFQGSPEGRANKCQRRAKGGLPRATSKKQGKSRAWQGALPKAGQFGSYDCNHINIISFHICYAIQKAKIYIL